jgi:hypothetical protein
MPTFSMPPAVVQHVIGSLEHVAEVRRAHPESIMAETSEWQVSSDAAEVYERPFVPAMLGQWAGR